MGLALLAVSGLIPHYTQAAILVPPSKWRPSALTMSRFSSSGCSRLVSPNETRSDVRLIAATQSLASLRALHERIVESIRSGVVTTDLQGLIYTFNAAAEEITGYKATDVRGQEASILFGDLLDQIRDSMQAAETGEPSPRFEADCLTADGLRLVWLQYLSALRRIG